MLPRFIIYNYSRLLKNNLFKSLNLVGARGFEPPTPWTPFKCATRLRYAPTQKTVTNMLMNLCQDRMECLQGCIIYRDNLLNLRKLVAYWISWKIQAPKTKLQINSNDPNPKFQTADPSWQPEWYCPSAVLVLVIGYWSAQGGEIYL